MRRALSLAAPAFNEAASLQTVLELWLQQLSALPQIESFEIVICNDGSRDRTGEILDELARHHPQLRPVHLPQNRGAAVAMRTAIRNTTLPWVLILDSDGQYGLDNLPAMLAALDLQPADGVHGVRRKKHAPAAARFGSWLSGKLCNLLLGAPYQDFNCTFNLLRGELARELPLEAKGLNYSTDILAKLGEARARLLHLPIHQGDRLGGASSMKLLRDASHRALFVGYLTVRRLLLDLGVLERQRL